MVRRDGGGNSFRRVRCPGLGRWTKIMMMAVAGDELSFLYAVPARYPQNPNIE
jgi:hypothetical protein